MRICLDNRAVAGRLRPRKNIVFVVRTAPLFAWDRTRPSRAPTNGSCKRAVWTKGGAAKMILQSLAGLPAFLVYFCTAIVAMVAYLFVYTRVTPHDEFQLIRDNVPA